MSAGAYWVTRRSGAAGFDRVAVVAPPPEPRVVGVARFLSRTMRLGGDGPEPAFDAGAPGPVPESWFVLRRVEGRAAS